jgi:peptidoglycan hydrolase-like protein with peptidoglycan-binding domain
MSYHKSMLPLGALGWPAGLEEAAGWSPPVTDPDRISPTAKAACGNVLAMQGALKDQGYYTGTVDNTIGKGTQAAIKQFSLDNGLGRKIWPDPTFCAALKGKQLALLQGKYEALHPPQPQGGQPGGAIDPGGTVTPGGGTVTPGQVAPPVVDGGVDNTRTYLFVGGLAVFAVVGLGIVFALKSGGSPEPAGA